MTNPMDLGRAVGWYVRRKPSHVRRFHLERLWHPSMVRESIEPDRYRAAAENPASRYEIGRPGPEIRLLALNILLGRFDWPVAWALHEPFVSEFLINLHLRPGKSHFIEKATISHWWAIKEDQVSGDDMPVNLSIRPGRAA